MELWSKMGKCSFVVTKESLQDNRIGLKLSKFGQSAKFLHFVYINFNG